MLRYGVIRTPLTAVIRKGKEHYICEKRLLSYYNAADLQTKELLSPYMPYIPIDDAGAMSSAGDSVNIKAVKNKAVMSKAIGVAKVKASNALISVNGSKAPFDLTDAVSLTPYVKPRICVIEKCGDSCKHKSSCRYQRYLKKANDPSVDLQITNHNYFLADTLHRASGNQASGHLGHSRRRRPLLPNYQLVIIDEAHKFLGTARSMYGLELTDRDLPVLAQEIHAITAGKSKGGVNMHRLAKRLEEQSRKLFQAINNSIPDDVDDEADRFPVVVGGNIGNNNVGRGNGSAGGVSVSSSNSSSRSGCISSNSDAVKYLTNILDIIDKLIYAVTGSRAQSMHTERRSKVLRDLNAIADRIDALCKYSNLIYWFEKRVEGETKTNALCAIPKDLGKRLHSDLWDNGIPIILTSGTLSSGAGRKSDDICANFSKDEASNFNRDEASIFSKDETSNQGDFTRVKETLGLNYMKPDRLFNTTMPSPFNYKNNKLLYISENIPFPDSKDKKYIAAVAKEIERLVIASHGHAAVLFTSYNVMGQVHAILKKRSNEGGLCIKGQQPFPLFRLERGGVHAIERFKKNCNDGNGSSGGNGILLASGALWEGIDIPGDALSMLIIVKLPFAVPDPIGDFEREQCGDMEAFKNRVIIPDMLVKLKQGDGRLIRCETDTGVCAILDSRVNERGAYRSKVLSALPECNVTSDIKAVRDFYLDKKPTAYFIS